MQIILEKYIRISNPKLDLKRSCISWSDSYIEDDFRCSFILMETLFMFLFLTRTLNLQIQLNNECSTYGPAMEGTPFQRLQLYEINEKIRLLTLPPSCIFDLYSLQSTLDLLGLSRGNGLGSVNRATR